MYSLLEVDVETEINILSFSQVEKSSEGAREYLTEISWRKCPLPVTGFEPMTFRLSAILISQVPTLLVLFSLFLDSPSIRPCLVASAPGAGDLVVVVDKQLLHRQEHSRVVHLER